METITNYFDTARFVNLVRYHLHSSLKAIYYTLLVVALMYLIFGITCGMSVILLCYLCIAPCLFEKAISKFRIVDFMLPVSAFEKLLYMCFKYIVVLPLVSFVLILILDLISHFVFRSHTFVAGDLLHTDFLKWLMFESFFIFGRFYYKKMAVLKTILLSYVILVVIFIIETIAFSKADGHMLISFHVVNFGHLLVFRMCFHFVLFVAALVAGFSVLRKKRL